MALVHAGSACTALYFGDTEQKSSPPVSTDMDAAPLGGDEDVRVDAGQPVLEASTDAEVDSGLAPACPNARFVDPFTNSDLLSTFWSDKVVTGAASLDVVPEGASTPGALYASARDASSGQAYLRLPRGALPVTWSFCLSFALKLPTTPSGTLFGPRIVSSTGNTNSTIALELKSRTLSLAFYNDGCPDGGTGCERDDRIQVGTIIGDEWTTITLLGEFGASSATVTASVSGGPAQTHAVTVPMHGFASAYLHVGISTLLGAKNVDLLIDDVRYDDTLGR